MNDLHKKIIELSNMETETVALRREIQRRIATGDSSGDLAVDYAVAAGLPQDAKTTAEINAFLNRLKGHEGEPVFILLADRRRPAGQAVVKEGRMGVMRGDPWFHFGENTGGWKLCGRFATCSEDGDVFIIEEPMFFSPTNGLLRPNATQRAVEGIWIGTAEVNGYLRGGPTFGSERLMALRDKLGLPPTTGELRRTSTIRSHG